MAKNRTLKWIRGEGLGRVNPKFHSTGVYNRGSGTELREYVMEKPSSKMSV